MRNSDSGTKAKTIDVGTKNILVADDDRHNRYILKKRLTRIGFSVKDVETGEEGDRSYVAITFPGRPFG